jgi:hypothetical protein
MEWGLFFGKRGVPASTRILYGVDDFVEQRRDNEQGAKSRQNISQRNL